jgi:hypothetical protein
VDAGQPHCGVGHGRVHTKRLLPARDGFVTWATTHR